MGAAGVPSMGVAGLPSMGVAGLPWMDDAHAPLGRPAGRHGPPASSGGKAQRSAAPS